MANKRRWCKKSETNHRTTKTTHCMTIILIICSSFWMEEKTHVKAAFLGKSHKIDVCIVHFSSSYHIVHWSLKGKRHLLYIYSTFSCLCNAYVLLFYRSFLFHHFMETDWREGDVENVLKNNWALSQNDTHFQFKSSNKGWLLFIF